MSFGSSPPRNVADPRVNRSSIGSGLADEVDADMPAPCAVADVARRVEPERVSLLGTHQRERHRLEQRALARAVLAEEHQPGRRGGRRREARRAEVEMVDHLEVPHLDPLDAAGATEVVDARVLRARERVRVLRALRRVEGALDASLLGGRDHAEVACDLRHGVRAHASWTTTHDRARAAGSVPTC